MSNFSKVSLGVANKRYTHNLDFDNNTSANFGGCQPLFCQLLNQGDKLSGNIRQLVRLAPMPVPTFGRMRVVNKLRFVPMVDICGYYEAMLSQQYVNNAAVNYLPVQVPFVTCGFLTAVILSRYALCSVYQTNTSGNFVPIGNIASATTKANSAFSSSLIGSVSASDASLTLNMQAAGTNGANAISFDSADYVIFPPDTTLALTFRLSENGKRLRSILLGLGYVFDLSASAKVNFLPLLAYYKAYFDSYAPKRSQMWMQTNAYTLIDFIFENYHIDFYELYQTADGQSSEKVAAAAKAFFDDLANTWYVSSDDYVSAHITDLSNQNSESSSVLSSPFSDLENNSFSNISLNGKYTYPQLSVTDSDSISGLTKVGLSMLQRFARFVNKDTIIGRRVSEWLKIHYGADVASSFFKESVSLDDIVVNCNVNDIFSSSDTFDETSKTGEKLGAYAGKGLGFGNGNFSFTAPTFGYFIVITCVVPDAGYFQGIDPTLFGLDRYTLPSADFDALGYEVTPKCFISSHNDIYDSSQEDTSTVGFGFIPRFSGFKTRRNIINGDMSRRGTIASYSPYYLDRILTENSVTSIKNDDYSYTVVNHHAKLPLASDVWRYPTRYNWLGDFDRIFYNAGNVDVEPEDSTDLNTTPHDDNFLIQSVINLKLTNKLKPIALSYDTFEEETDTSMKSVSNQ